MSKPPTGVGRGNHVNHPRKVSDDARALIRAIGDRMTGNEIARVLGVARQTVYLIRAERTEATK